MSDVENPWQSPQNASVPQPVARGVLTDTMLRYLGQASPWLRFIGVLGFVGCGFLALIGIIMVFTGSVLGGVWGELFDSVPGMESFSGAIGTVFGVFMMVYLLLVAVLCFFPSLFIYNFGSKISAYLHSSADGDLEAAFRNNKSFWKFCGILAIVSLAFIPLTIVGSIIAVVAAAIGG